MKKKKNSLSEFEKKKVFRQKFWRNDDCQLKHIFSHFFRFFINLTEKAASERESEGERERENDNFYSNSCVGTKP